MEFDLRLQPGNLSAIWLLLGILIFIGNAITSLAVWLRKRSQEKSHFGLKLHAAHNLLGIDIAFSVMGLTLTVTSILRLSKNGHALPVAACNILGFSQTFSFHFSAVALFVLQADKLYCLVKPFAYHVYSRTKSNIPSIVFICCAVYATIIAILPLTRLGNYCPKTTYTNCMFSWNQNRAFRIGLSLNIILILLTIVFISQTARQKLKLVQKRREMKVATSHRNETIIFALIVSSLFVVCWSPSLVAMLVSTFFSEDHPEDTTKAVLFSATLLPPLLNPLLTFFLRADCRVEYGKCWTYFKNYAMAKKTQRTSEKHTVKRTAVFAVDLEIKQI